MVRFKNRYIVIEVNPIDNEDNQSSKPFRINQEDLYLSLLNAVHQMHGDFGVATIKLGFQAKYCNEHTRIAILKVRHGPHRIIASCLPFTNFRNTPATIRTLFIGATIRQCYKFVVTYQTEQLEKIYSDLRNDAEREKMKEAFLNFNFNL